MKVESAKKVVVGGPIREEFKPHDEADYQSERQFPAISSAVLLGAVITSVLFKWPVYFPGELQSEVHHEYVSDQQISCQSDHLHSALTANSVSYAPPEWAVPSAKKLPKEEG